MPTPDLGPKTNVAAQRAFIITPWSGFAKKAGRSAVKAIDRSMMRG
jgi:hypothetical protein